MVERTSLGKGGEEGRVLVIGTAVSREEGVGVRGTGGVMVPLAVRSMEAARAASMGEGGLATVMVDGSRREAGLDETGFMGTSGQVLVTLGWAG